MFLLNKTVAAFLAMLAQQAAMDKDFKPLAQMTGADTLVEQSRAAMISSEGEWRVLWRAHKEQYGNSNLDPAPTVDFQKNVVICYFGGSGRGVDGYQIYKVDTKGEWNVIQIVPHLFTGGQVLSNSFAMWIFPKPKRKVEIQMFDSVNNGEPVFKKIAIFEPPKKSN